MSKTPPKRKATPSKSPETLTILECHQLLDKLIVKAGTPRQFRLSVRNYTMALLMLDAGLRVGEVVKLLQADLILAGEPMLNLRIRAEISKTKTERIIPLSTRLRDSLKTMQVKWWKQFEGKGDLYAFFTFYSCNPLTTRQVERIIGKASAAAFGREVNPHILRHTFASKLMRIAPIRVVQDLLGHRQLSSTQVYTHPNSEDKKKAIDALICEETGQTSQID